MSHKIQNFDRTHDPPPIPIPIFYNLYTKSPEEIKKVKKIVSEQLQHMKSYHYVLVRSVGTPNPIEQTTLLQHDDVGNEKETLGLLWEYCKSHPQEKVVYLHSKGSYHTSRHNTKRRRIITRGALSTECANLPETCNVCSSRMSPIPHPHPPGNMWLARCEYVQRLIDPRVFEDKMSEVPISEKLEKPYPDYCFGHGRYAAEHWIHSHPTVKPCDLLMDENFVWSYKSNKILNMTLDLQPAPRFPLSVYLARYDKSDMMKHSCGYNPRNNSKVYEEVRVNEYQFLYGEDPPDDWFGWNTYNPLFYSAWDTIN